MALDRPILTPKDAPDLGRFDWADPLRLDTCLTEDERLLRDAAQTFAASELAPRVVAAARNRVSGGRGPGESTYAALEVRPIDEALTRYYVNLDVADKPGVLASIAQAFADNGVSIQVVRQDGHGDDAGLIVRTHLATEGALRQTVDRLRTLDAVKQVVGVMRVEGEAGP